MMKTESIGEVVWWYTKEEADTPPFSEMVTNRIHLDRPVWSFLISIWYFYILCSIFKYIISPEMISGENYLKESLTVYFSKISAYWLNQVGEIAQVLKNEAYNQNVMNTGEM